MGKLNEGAGSAIFHSQFTEKPNNNSRRFNSKVNQEQMSSFQTSYLICLGHDKFRHLIFSMWDLKPHVHFFFFPLTGRLVVCFGVFLLSFIPHFFFTFNNISIYLKKFTNSFNLNKFNYQITITNI